MDEKEKLLTFCGLYCGDCPGFQGRISDLARDLRRELRTSKIWICDKFAEFISSESANDVSAYYRELYNTLGMMVAFRCKKICKNGGGVSFCTIRDCCQKKGINGCWECKGFEDCEKLNCLTLVHGDAHLKNLRIIKKRGTKEFINGKRYWYCKIK